MRKTKIICTLGPATDRDGVLRSMIEMGMDVARFNFSHGTHEQHKKRFDALVALREEMGLPIATMLDTKGPDVRLGNFEGGSVTLEAGQIFRLVTWDELGNNRQASISYGGLPGDIQIGTKLLVDDGRMEWVVEDKTHTYLDCRVLVGGVVSDHKSINVPGVSLSMSYMSKADEDDLLFGIECGFDFIAASFVRCADDVLQIRRLLDKNGCSTIRIIAKIENRQGVQNIDEIIRVSDGIMIARGDMGVELALEEVPVIQKMLIKKTYTCEKQVITATQMLESMMQNPRPTRAEATDVANAIYDGTSAIMLSGETAAGKYPVEAVETMARIAKRAEDDIDYEKRFSKRIFDAELNIENAIAHATCTTAWDLKASAIITVTQSGQTARLISKFRPQTPIIACTTTPVICRHLNMAWGITPLVIAERNDTDILFADAVAASQKAGLVKEGDLVVITAGVPLGTIGSTNMMRVYRV